MQEFTKMLNRLGWRWCNTWGAVYCPDCATDEMVKLTFDINFRTKDGFWAGCSGTDCFNYVSS